MEIFRPIRDGTRDCKIFLAIFDPYPHADEALDQIQNLGLNVACCFHAKIFVNLNRKNFTSTHP